MMISLQTSFKNQFFGANDIQPAFDRCPSSFESAPQTSRDARKRLKTLPRPFQDVLIRALNRKKAPCLAHSCPRHSQDTPWPGLRWFWSVFGGPKILILLRTSFKNKVSKQTMSKTSSTRVRAASTTFPKRLKTLPRRLTTPPRPFQNIFIVILNRKEAP